MGTARTYEPGTPSWVDLGTPDVDGDSAFYGVLFGWTAEGFRAWRRHGRLTACSASVAPT